MRSRVFLTLAVTGAWLLLLAGLAGCSQRRTVVTCDVLAKKLVATLTKEAKGKEDERSLKVTAEHSLLQINNACNASPWKIEARDCLNRAETGSDMTKCGDAGRQAVGIFEGALRVKGVSGPVRTFNSETGTWWIGDKDTHSPD